ncbi:hypothetical protein LRAMOSA11213 [Lichtheimia ramosa]|uniref:Uncharacterized protein n=1 Tax=Lichtheimia ramosa TaxID=688394 RepID=A0A077WVG0_9FUNG|nr:hypothetical protein LRAMOSA11213 [Lichtheimia ramosa]
MIQNHNHVLMSLEMEFKRMDRMFSQGDMRLFGKDTEHIFQELDVIRRKQIDLARDHISLESMSDLPQSSEVNMEHDYQQSIDSFHKKELALKNLMIKLDDLGESMNRFRRLFEPTMVHEYSSHHPMSASLSYPSNTSLNAPTQQDHSLIP